MAIKPLHTSQTVSTHTRTLSSVSTSTVTLASPAGTTTTWTSSSSSSPTPESTTTTPAITTATSTTSNPRLPIAATFAQNPSLTTQPLHDSAAASSTTDVNDSSATTAEARPSLSFTPRSKSSDSIKHHATSSIGSAKHYRSSLLAWSSLREKTNKSISSLSESSLKTRSSLNNLLVHSAPFSNIPPPPVTEPRPSLQSPASGPIPRNRSDGALTSLAETDPPSQPYNETDSDLPAPSLDLTKRNKMHQTSSRLLRMTSDDRPFTRDFKDLFSTLVVSLPLGPHRVRLTRIDHSFLSEEAINNLGSLKFSQSNRMPDPKDSTRIVTTTTTTTFSMAKEMARSVCQRFLDARFIESADGKQAKEFALKGMVWQLTPKGIHVLEIFCGRNGIQQKHVSELLQSPRNTMQLVVLERSLQTDRLSFDRVTIEVIFRRFIGQDGPNIKDSVSAADSDSLSDYKDGMAGVKMAKERKIGLPPRTFYSTFTGKGAIEWLMDCCTTVDRKETIDLASAFLEQGLIACVQADKPFLGGSKDKDKEIHHFQASKNAIYQMSPKGKEVVETTKERQSESESANSMLSRAGVSRDSNTQKLEKILNDAALRLLFRENLRDTHCEENLSFYLDVCEFLQQCKQAMTAAKGGTPRTPSTKGSPQGLDLVKETMASAYGLYNAFLAPGSPCELNIDHLLRNQLATRMTKSVGQDAAMVESLKEVTKLFEEAQVSVFKLMASDSVPKFIKTAKYEQTLKNYDLDTAAPPAPARFNSSSSGSPAPERSLSISNR